MSCIRFNAHLDMCHEPQRPFTDAGLLTDNGKRPQCDGELSLRRQQELHRQGFLDVAIGKNSEDSNLVSVEANQRALLCLSHCQYRCYWEYLAQHGQNVPEHHACSTLVLWLPVVHLPVALANHVWGSLGSCCCKSMWQNIQAYHTITKNPIPHINAELLSVSTQCAFRYSSQINVSGHMLT
jgi:hypothetical protein